MSNMTDQIDVSCELPKCENPLFQNRILIEYSSTGVKITLERCDSIDQIMLMDNEFEALKEYMRLLNDR